jgi:L-threonylcarbamoyladenylate synthase
LSDPGNNPIDTKIAAVVDPEALDRAVELLGQGQLVAIPTETVYGLAANALSPEAVNRVFNAKGRPANNPLIVHVESAEMARSCVSAWPSAADRLAEVFWPGPLSIVLPKADLVPDIVTAGGETVAVRCPAHPVMLAVLSRCGFPLAAPSANLSNQVSPTRARHVAEQLADRIPMILDGGACEVGIESTVVDLTGEIATVLRPGMVSPEQIREVLGEVRTAAGPRSGDALKSPGQLPLHYSPKARVILAGEDWKKSLGQSGPKAYVISTEPPPADFDLENWHQLPASPDGYARSLYDTLNQCDQTGAELILIQSLPSGAGWDAIRDRLSRAASGS